MRVSQTESYLFLQIRPIEREGIRNDGKSNKVVVGNQLCRGECRKGVKQQLSASLELSDRKEVKTSINLQSVTTVPVSTLFDKSGPSDGVSESEGTRLSLMSE